ncbi:MAG: ribosome maturation factor RimM [Alphaproteobacteria bacterium]|nr:ribosome maturation factor RimM [Alphaproteobacteria bacterium]
MSHLVCVGQIVKAHGIKGLVCIQPYLNDPAGLTAFGALTDESGRRIFEIDVRGRRGDILLAALPGIADKTAADALKGTKLYVHKDKLPALAADEYYHRDLVGLAVVHQGKPFGSVAQVANYGAGDILDIRLASGKTIPFLFSRQTFPVVDIARKTIEMAGPDNMEELVDES